MGYDDKEKKIQIYVFRHGETDWNAERRFQGHTDIPLNQKGEEQAKNLQKIMAQFRPELILSSDLTRALQTAQIASHNMDIPIIKSDKLREALLGEAEGRKLDDILTAYGPSSWDRWVSAKEEDMDFGYPKGETKRQFLQRALGYLNNFFEETPDFKRVAISTHGGILRRLVHYCQGAPLDPIPIPNCATYEVKYLIEDKSWHFRGSVVD